MLFLMRNLYKKPIFLIATKIHDCRNTNKTSKAIKIYNKIKIKIIDWVKIKILTWDMLL